MSTRRTSRASSKAVSVAAKDGVGANQSNSDNAAASLPLCWYGLQCYRKNPSHFQEFSHPDIVLIRAGVMTPSVGSPMRHHQPARQLPPPPAQPVAAAATSAPSPPPRRQQHQQLPQHQVQSQTQPTQPQDNRKPCIYGAQCYRRNPAHLTMFSHPPRPQQPKASVAPAVVPASRGGTRSSTASNPRHRFSAGDKRKRRQASPSAVDDFGDGGDDGDGRSPASPTGDTRHEDEDELKQDMAAVLAGATNGSSRLTVGHPKQHDSYDKRTPSQKRRPTSQRPNYWAGAADEEAEDFDDDDDDDDDRADERTATAVAVDSEGSGEGDPAMSEAAQALEDFMEISSDSGGDDLDLGGDGDGEVLEPAMDRSPTPTVAVAADSMPPPPPAPPRASTPSWGAPRPAMRPPSESSARFPRSPVAAPASSASAFNRHGLLSAAMQSTVVTNLGNLEGRDVHGPTPPSFTSGSNLSILSSSGRGSNSGDDSSYFSPLSSRGRSTHHSELLCEQTVISDHNTGMESIQRQQECSPSPSLESRFDPPAHPNLDVSMSFISDTSSANPDRAFEILGILGQGQFATCFRARPRFPRADGRAFVALKVIKKPRFTQAQLDVIRTEAEIMKQIQHRGCVRLLDNYETPSRYILVLELLEGGELFNLIVAQRSFSEPRTARVVAQLASALHFLHQQGIVHRDIKPENILLTSEPTATPPSDSSNTPNRRLSGDLGDDWEVKLADFGLAFVKGEIDAEERANAEDREGAAKKKNKNQRQICGTPNYIAPEVLDQEQVYEEAIDLWSLGVVAYIMLCGFPPFAGETMIQLLRNIRKAQLQFPEPYWTHISDEAKDLVRGMLRKDPSERLSAQEVLAHPFVRLHVASAGSPVSPAHAGVDSGVVDDGMPQKAVHSDDVSGHVPQQQQDSSVAATATCDNQRRQQSRGTTASHSPNRPAPGLGGHQSEPVGARNAGANKSSVPLFGEHKDEPKSSKPGGPAVLPAVGATKQQSTPAPPQPAVAQPLKNPHPDSNGGRSGRLRFTIGGIVR